MPTILGFAPEKASREWWGISLYATSKIRVRATRKARRRGGFLKSFPVGKRTINTFEGPEGKGTLFALVGRGPMAGYCKVIVWHYAIGFEHVDQL